MTHVIEDARVSGAWSRRPSEPAGTLMASGPRFGCLLRARRESNPQPSASKGENAVQQSIAGVGKPSESFGSGGSSDRNDGAPNAGFRNRLLTMDLQPTDLLTVRDVAARLGVCRATIYELCRRRDLEHIRVLNAVRIPLAAVATYLDSHRSSPAVGGRDRQIDEE